MCLVLSRLRLLFALVCIGAGALAEEAPLTECAAIRALPREVAAQGRPVQLRGVVMFCYRKKGGAMVVQNGGVGIYVHGLKVPDASLPDWLARGTAIELTGMTGAGNFAPVIHAQKIRVLGTEPLPEPMMVSFSELLDGKWDCQSVRLRGVVQFAEDRPKDAERVRLELAANGGRITINVLEPLPDLPRLVDADLEVDGVMFTYFNNRGELVGARVQVMNGGDVRVLRRGPEDPFTAPEVPLSTLRPFSLEGVTFHRRRCSGTVTLARPGQFFYLQEAGRGVRVETRDPTPLAPGDRVEVSGFVEVGDHFGKLREAVVRKVGVAPRPAPVPVVRKRVLGTDLPGSETDADDVDGLYATLHGRLEKVDLSDAEGPRLLVESEGRLVSATLRRDTPPAALARFEPGSEVRIDGVIRVELASGWPAQDFPRPVNFRLFVHAPEDLAVVRAAPWWTPQRLWLLLGGICTVLAGTLGWNWLLRRRVEQRGAQLAEEMRARREAEVEFDATLRERERLAADLHDTLEQSLTGVAFRLETMVVRREKAQDYSDELDRVRQLFASTREDVRRSIWNLRANALEGRTLPEAIQHIVGRLAGGRAITVSVETEGIVRALPDFIAGNLLLLALEAVTNALKHAEPRSILVRVAFAEKTVALTVEDDGRGFDLAQASGPNEGHFGIQGMRERVKRLGGTLEVTSAPGKGSRFSVTVPVRAFAG
jgi:signal transduction histidine kinase